MAIRLQILTLLVFCGLCNPLQGQVAFGGNIPAAYKNYILGNGDNPADKIKGNLFIKVEVDKTSCHAGEPILLTYKLCTRVKSLSTLVKNPSFNGFSVVDMPTPDFTEYGFETIKGQQYNVFRLRKVQLYPLQAGTLQVEAAVVENSIQFIKESYLLKQPGYSYNPEIVVTDLLERIDKGIIDKAALTAYATTITSAPINITVKDYPVANKPLGFTGATGQYSIAAALSEQQLSTDEVGKLTLSINGKGNMMLITAPEIAWPNGLEAFEPAAIDRVSHTTMPISGSKFFEYRFTAAKAGRYTIPPISFSWFDVQKGSYQTANTAPLTIDVQQGSGKQPTDTVSAEPAKEKFFNRLFANRWWVAGPVIGLILLGLVLWVRSENKKDKKAKAMAGATNPAEADRQPVAAETGNPLESAAALLQQPNSARFYAQLNNDLKKYLTQQLQLPVFSKTTLAAALDQKGISPDTAIELMAVLDALEWQLYTPSSDTAAMEPLYQRTLSLVETVNYEVRHYKNN